MSDLISRSELLHYMKNTELSQYIDEVNDVRTGEPYEV